MDSGDVVARLEKFEGRVPYMCFCTGGEVTVGIGHAIASSADAARLAWQTNAASAQSDFAAVAAAPKGLAATHYSSLTTCRMSDDAINQLATADVQRITALLTSNLPNWSSYPAQAALFDMAYNLGIGGLMKSHNLLAAVDAGNRETAAQQCHSLGISDARNQETAALSLHAAG
jgi:GH24 family phage-related lysozyme (muramidase)